MFTTTKMHGMEKRFGAAAVACLPSYGRLQTPQASISINLDWRCGP